MVLPGKGTSLYADTKYAYRLIMNGVVISIDPSCGSNSSMPGYAVYDQGELVDCGVLELTLGRPLHERLQELSRGIRMLYKTYNPDVLVYEDLAPQRYGGGNAGAHASLLKALGVVLSVPGPVAYVGMKPIVWKKLVRDTYKKGDVEDALEMGWIALSISREWSTSVSYRSSKKTKTKRKRKKQPSNE